MSLSGVVAKPTWLAFKNGTFACLEEGLSKGRIPVIILITISLYVPGDQSWKTDAVLFIASASAVGTHETENRAYLLSYCHEPK